MTIKIGDKEYCLDGYMTEIQKLIFDAYHQGLVDGIGKGRADAIEELEKIVNKIFNIQNNGKSKFIPSIVISKGMMEDILEQLKEQNNE